MSAVEEPWKLELTFAQRVNKILQIATAYGGDERSAKERAKSAEADIYARSASLIDYDRLCNGLVAANGISHTHEVHDGVDSTDLAPPLHSGESIGEYVNAVHHQDGLFSTVYKAYKPPLENGTVVALKVTTPSLMIAPHDSKREARILQTLQNGHIIPLLDSFNQPHGRLVLVFPFMPFTLQDYLKEPDWKLDIAKSHLRDLFSALEHLHSHGIIHRDVKPSNLLLASPQGPTYLADFGIAWSDADHVGETVNEKITDVGTTCYRPPELLFGHMSYSYTLDLWAAGCVAAELMTADRKSLFDPGPLGSELGLILSIFNSLGTPNEETWPEVITFRDWGKMNFTIFEAQPWDELLPHSSLEGRDFVSKLLKYESAWRLSANEALQHPFLQMT